MTSIIGNQEQRKSKINTEKWKEHKEYYSNPRNTEVKAEEVLTQENLENKILTHDYRGNPKIKLTNYSSETDIVVNIKTQREYDTLMQIYESAGWTWFMESSEFRGLPTAHNMWKKYGEDTCITVGMVNIFGSLRRGLDFKEKKYYQQFNYQIIDLNKFLELQNITPKILRELNEYHDNIGPRRSKG